MRKGFCTLPKMSKMWGFRSISKNVGRRGTFEEDLQRCISRGRCNMLGGPGADFLRGGCILEHQIFRSAKMILVTGAALYCATSAILWTDGMEKLQNALVRGCQLWGSLADLLRFDVVNLEQWGSLAEFFRFNFWRCQVQKLRKSRRIAAFLMLSPSKMEEALQNCFFFKLADWR